MFQAKLVRITVYKTNTLSGGMLKCYTLNVAMSTYSLSKRYIRNYSTPNAFLKKIVSSNGGRIGSAIRVTGSRIGPKALA
jgi:hypothetical protein